MFFEWFSNFKNSVICVEDTECPRSLSWKTDENVGWV